MIIKRRKTKMFAFSVPQPGKTIQQPPSGNQQPQSSSQGQQQPSNEVTMKDLQLEQARLQRQQIQIQHQKSQLLLKDDMARRRNVVQLQRIKQEEDESRIKNSIRVKKEENDNNDEARARNASLYKSRSKLVQPVGMPKTKL